MQVAVSWLRLFFEKDVGWNYVGFDQADCSSEGSFFLSVRTLDPNLKPSV